MPTVREEREEREEKEREREMETLMLFLIHFSSYFQTRGD
jgi:hypothetical protein